MENQNEQEFVQVEEDINISEPVEEIIENSESIEEMKDSVEETSEAIGKVIAEQLYVRTGPGKEFDHFMVLGKDTKINIDLDFVNEDFYKIVTFNGTEGYCMKKFIEII